MKLIKNPIFIVIISSFLMSCATGLRKSAPPFRKHSKEYFSKKENINVEFNKKRIVYTASLTILAKKPDTARAHIERIAEKYEGYILEKGTERTRIRVEKESFKQALEDIYKLGKVTEKVIRGEDFSAEYSDYQIRLENAEKARARYLELLKKAENVEAALKVEKELERLNETIELLKDKMNKIDHLTEYSTITVYVKEKKKPGIIGYVFVGLYHTVKWLFVRN